ncbi:HdeD family acid-resistance protein [Streptomyces sp. NPDC094038]|uniref:HdeD family acid-resistance protein n=1 Tax=Streptomyces sp. NPDC094038 TaxID=3366055 RepID=UPI0037F95FA6
MAVALGLIAVVWPGVTVGALVVLFAVHCFTNAGNDAAVAFRGDRAGPVVGRLLPAFVSLAAGVTALVWPGITALALAVWIAIWAIAAGLFEVGFAFRRGALAGDRALWILSGLATLAFGVVLAVRPDAGVLALATLFGFYAIVHGVCALATAAHTSSRTRAGRNQDDGSPQWT